MIPYLTAFQEYQKHDRGESWTDALDFHLQRGAVISTPELFVMARPVRREWEDDLHTMLGPVAKAGDCWHVWVGAGNLHELLDLARRHGVQWLTYQRHGQDRLRCVPLVHLFKRAR
jgi:hypothetical protein